MRIAFLGTPEFAVPSLRMLIAEGHELAVFTQPDRPKDRGHALAMPAVKLAALEAGIPVYQFEKIRLPEGVEALAAFMPDLVVTAAFGQLLSAENLAVPKYGTVNVHGSLLPKYRGASPIQTAIIEGEGETGVTTMLTSLGMDTGDILLAAKTPIGENETYGELYSRLAELGAELLKETIARIETGTLEPVPQDDALATRCRPIKKQDAEIDFSLPSKRIHDLVRGLNPAPTAFARLGEANIRIHRTQLIPQQEQLFEKFTSAAPGECVIASPKQGLIVRTGDGFIGIAELQFPGGKRLEAKAAMNGKKLLGCRFEQKQEV
ncbi:MAG: methionyl-tRNA formyltransferase [Clostridia bacterium]|nr:methionyl-tRNA formyltransferase [Clostridia bacterium]